MTNASHQGILVAVDGSPCSEHAVRWAAAEAALRHERLSIVSVAIPLADGWSGAGYPGPHHAIGVRSVLMPRAESCAIR